MKSEFWNLEIEHHPHHPIPQRLSRITTNDCRFYQMISDSYWEGEWRVKTLQEYPTNDVTKIIPDCGIRLTIQRKKKDNNASSPNTANGSKMVVVSEAGGLEQQDHEVCGMIPPSGAAEAEAEQEQEQDHEYSLSLTVQNTFEGTLSIRPAVTTDYGGESNPIEIGPFVASAVEGEGEEEGEKNPPPTPDESTISEEVAAMESLLITHLPDLEKGCIVGRGHMYLTGSTFELTLEQYEDGKPVGEDPQEILNNYLKKLGMR